jgi:hypothetical protein
MFGRLYSTVRITMDTIFNFCLTHSEKEFCFIR